MTERTVTPDRRITWPPQHTPETSNLIVHNSIEVSAPPERVWSLLVDCTDWPRWYKHATDVAIVRGQAGTLTQDSRFRFKTLGFYFEPEIETFEPYHLLVWTAKGPLGTSGAHAWFLEPISRGCRVITEETQKGLLLFFLKSRVRRDLHNFHEEWLRSMKEQAEKKASLL